MKCAIFLCLTSYIIGANTGAVSYIEPCHWNDSECILKSARKALPFFVNGVPELGIDSMNPMVLKEVNADNGELKLNFKNLKVNRLAECEITKALRPEKLKTIVEFECPISVTGEYKADGTLLGLPLNGEGDCEINTEKVKISVTIIKKEFSKDGKDYYKFASFDYKYDPVKKFFLKFHNLYNGDEEKAKPIHKIFDEAWKEIISSIGLPVIKAVITTAVQACGKLYSSVPTNELEIP